MAGTVKDAAQHYNTVTQCADSWSALIKYGQFLAILDILCLYCIEQCFSNGCTHTLGYLEYCRGYFRCSFNNYTTISAI